MTWLQFIGSMASSLAWPTAVVLIVFFLRRELVALLKRIAEISLPGGYKVIFEKSLAQSGAAIAEIPSGEMKLEAKERWFKNEDVFASLIARHPPSNLTLMGQMLNAYSYLLKLVLEVRDIIEKPEIDDPAAVVRELARQRLVEQQFVTAFENIRKARNALVHLDENEVDANEAINFVGQVMHLTQYLETLKLQKAPPKLG